MLQQLIGQAVQGFGLAKLDLKDPHPSTAPETLEELREDEKLPAGNEISLGSQVKFMNPSLVTARLAHSQFQLNLGHFERYCIWKYTFGSGKVNRYLIDAFPDARERQLAAVFWTSRFFHDFSFSVYKQHRIHPVFKPYLRFFEQPDLFVPRNVPERSIPAFADKRAYEAHMDTHHHNFEELADIAERIIVLYIGFLTKIILAAPAHRTLRVYKSSALYPGVPKDRTIDREVTITQQPFNSTSYDPAFNYGTFIAEEDHWLLWSLTIPPETPCLVISDLLHAYPFENEVLLPPGVKFNVTASTLDDMKYISKEEYTTRGMRQIQPNIQRPLLAPVFMLNTDFDPVIRSKRMHLLEATVLP